MKHFSFLTVSILFLHANVIASIADDLTTNIINNDIPGVIDTIESAAGSSIPLAQMLAYAQIALNNTTNPQYNNASRRYVYDFELRPTISQAASNVVYVDQSLFMSGQIGYGHSGIVTSDRIIFPTVQQAMDYIGAARTGQWSVITNQAFYDENVSISPGQAITWISVGGVVIGNGGADQFSSTVSRTVTWNLDDSQNVVGVTPTLKLQATPFGDGGYRNMPYMSNFTIGNVFTTQITGTITSSPLLEFDSVYLWGGMGSSPTDIGPVNMVIRNVRSGGSINFTSANIQSIESSSIIPPMASDALGNVTNTLIYDAWTINLMTGVVKDSLFGQSSKEFTIQSVPKVLDLNVSSNYWWMIKTWSVNPGTTVQVVNQ